MTLVGKRMRSLMVAILLIVTAGPLSAAVVTLDFSSGDYIERPPSYNVNQYDQDGFSVYTTDPSDTFHETFGTYGPTLAWYETDIVIRIDGPEPFTLRSVDVPTPAFAGLEFTSSTGGSIQTGSGTGTLYFSGPDWSDMDYFTVRTPLSFDILTELDNIEINTVPLPSSLFLLASCLIGLRIFRNRA
ncbi:hypothetical protein D3OALGA1CA_4476 [Olavius algarvensis associated proteobacterium Delta 3]|nr:hypothetical protein D3OALGA1CA_4476 [Olavius algarvensis associated proteobacterium Delta 3]